MIMGGSVGIERALRSPNKFRDLETSSWVLVSEALPSGASSLEET